MNSSTYPYQQPRLKEFYAFPAAGALMDPAKGGNIFGRTAVAAMVGGTATAIGGGKFANGANTAAFQHLFNQESKKYGSSRNFVVNRWKNQSNLWLSLPDYHRWSTHAGHLTHSLSVSQLYNI